MSDWKPGSPWRHQSGIDVHLAHRDTTLLAAYRQRMGWSFKWVSTFGSDFNFDYGVSFTPEQIAQGEALQNYGSSKSPGSETVGISVFFKDEGNAVFHTYSCYSRGVDMLNGAYHYLDLTPKGRDEAPDRVQAWVRRHDEYTD